MRKFYGWIAVGALLAVICCLLMLSRIGHRLVVSVDGFDLSHTSAVGIGRLSDICFHRIPHDFLTVRRNGQEMEWSVSEECLKKDSLCYFKINNSNPNLHPVDVQSVVSVDLDAIQLHVQLTAGQIRQLLSGQKSHYVMLRNVLEKQRLAGGETPRLTRDFKAVRQLKSFFYRSDERSDDWQLMILDRYTTLRQSGGATVGYARSGRVDAADEGYCKIQFYRMAEYSYKPDRPSRDAFTVDDVCYLAKPLLLTTEWGAGHVMVKALDDGGLGVRFPKPVTYAEHCDTLRALASGSSHLLTIQQFDGSFPVANSLYIPPFSAAVQQEVCNIRIAADSILVDRHRLKPGFLPLPRMEAWQLPTISGHVNMRAGVISMGFVLSYLWLPLAILLLIIPAYRWSVSVSNAARTHVPQARQLPAYFTIIALIAGGYMACKMMMALKLSYTYPYFEKVTGIIVVSAALTLLLFYQLSLLLNHEFLVCRVDTDHWHDSRTFRRWGAWLAALAGWILCFFAFSYADRTFSAQQIDAYLPGEVFSPAFWKWDRMNGVTDTHRSVPYTLFLVNAVAWLALTLLNLLPGLRRSVSPGRLMAKGETLAARWAQALRQRKKDSHEQPQHRFSRPQAKSLSLGTVARNGLWDALAAIVSGIGHAILPCVMIMAVSVIPGNFATALITVGVILGMSWSLTRVDFSQGSLWAFFEMFVITLVYLVAAIAWGDKGYLTNYLGFVFVIVIVYLMSNKGEPAKNESRWMMGLTIGAVLFAVFVIPRLLPLTYDVEDVSYDRTPRRFEMFSQFEKYMNSGYRYAVADAEFMTVLTHYMYNADGSDPLSAEHHLLHPSVSTGQSPVVLNDVAVPAALFGAYGWMAYLVYFGLLALLLVAVCRYSLQSSTAPGDVYIDGKTLWRIIAVMMWAGTTLYLYASYVGRMPFTGRLNPGLGIDAVGEALETAALLAFMTATTLITHQSHQSHQSRP